jgi:hypothetical protein
MTIKTRINDIIENYDALEGSNGTGVVTEQELGAVFGGSGNAAYAASDQAFQDYVQAQQTYESARNDALQAAGNLEFGSATQHANEAYNAYQAMQDARTNLENAVDHDFANDTQTQIDIQIANGHDYSPVDGNMSNYDGSVGVGTSSNSY